MSLKFAIRSSFIFAFLFLSNSWGLDSSPASAPVGSKEEKKAFTVEGVSSTDLKRRAQMVATILERYHYSRRRLNPEMAERYFKSLIEYLDYNHIIFYQSDVDQLKAKWLPTLDQSLLEGEFQLALETFQLFLVRFEEKEKLVQKLLLEKYDFTDDESFLPDRSKEAFPKDNLEAEKLWRSRVKFELLTGKLNKEKSDETIKTISRRYARRLKEFKEFSHQDVVDDSMRILCRTFDPHSDFLPEEDLKDFTMQTIDLKLSGIGAELTVEDGYAKVRRVIPGSPAEASKRVNANDRIVAVAQGSDKPVDVVDMPLKKIVQLIRGKAGSEVRLTIIPSDAPDPTLREVVTIIRGEIELKDAMAHGRLLEYQDAQKNKKRVGIIYLNGFYKDCTEHIEKFLRRFEQEQVQGVVLDMRRNGGGLLGEAISLTGLFIDKGPVVQVRDSGGGIQVYEDEDGKISYTGPLVVMVGHQSASAAEIVAAALQDYGRAVVVGDSQTHGKGTVQILQEMDKLRNFWDPKLSGAIKFTMQKFYRISGGSTQQKGVIPDLPIPSLLDVAEMGERYLPNSLPFDEIAPSKYQSAVGNDKIITELKQKSDQRCAQNQEFKLLSEEMEIFRKRLLDKTVSLQESKRIQEKNELKQRAEQRSALRKQVAAKTEKNWDITLDDIASNKTLEAISKTPKVRPPKVKNKEADEEEGEDHEDINDLQMTEGVQILLDLSQMVRHKSAPIK